VAIGELAKEKLIIDNYAKVEPIKTEEYQTPANRPKFSLMNCENTYDELNIRPKHWRKSLSEVLNQLKIGS
jgi:dTDP-4-dehydrorhamnose reductase